MSIMSQLTNREKDVARLLAAGRSQRDIARILCLQPDTVYGYTKRMRVKTGYSTSGIAIKAAFEAQG